MSDLLRQLAKQFAGSQGGSVSAKRALPAVNAVGQSISGSHDLNRGPSAWNQSRDNCLDIACDIASQAGYEASPSQLRDQMQLWQEMQAAKRGMFGISPSPENLTQSKSLRRMWEAPTEPASTAHIVIREGDSLMRHASFENYGKEYNYGPAGQEYPIVLRIPLRKPGSPAGVRLLEGLAGPGPR